MATSFTSDFHVPTVVAEGESSVLRITLYGTGASLAGFEFYVITPAGQAKPLTTSLVDVSANLPFTFISLFEISYNFQTEGHYTFLLHDTATGNVWVDRTFAAPWATRIDIPVSDLKRQRTDIERVYGKLNRG